MFDRVKAQKLKIKALKIKTRASLGKWQAQTKWANYSTILKSNAIAQSPNQTTSILDRKDQTKK